MSLWKIAWRSIQQRALASTLTAVAMGLGVSLVVAVLVVHAVVQQSFHRGGEGYDLIVGAKGSSLQLVLNSVFYLEQPVGTIPASYCQDLLEGRMVPEVLVEAAIPIATGHSFQGRRVVGTVPEMFEELKYAGDKKYEFIEGSNFKAEDPFDAVAGWEAAKATGLKCGSKFKAIHGVPGKSGETHQQQFTVVGILAPTSTPVDRALFVNIQGFYQIHAKQDKQDAHTAEDTGDHAGHDHADHEHGEEVTAILVCVDQTEPGQEFRLAFKINRRQDTQAAFPGIEIDKLFKNLIGNVQLILLIMAVLIVVVAGVGIMVSIYNSMSDRRHEIAIMRALGASRLTVMAVILLESILLSLGGGVLGLLLGHGLIGALSPLIVEQTGVSVSLLHFRPVELVLIPGLIILASVVGYLPAVAAYRTDVARSLTANP